MKRKECVVNMKKTVSFTKDLEFPTMIGEITEITLEDSLNFIDSNNIEGSFFIGGKYKMTMASRLEEDFSFNLPVEISITEKLEENTCKVSISDFTYEIIDESILRANIEVLIEGRELIEDDNDEAEIDADIKEDNDEVQIDVDEKEEDTIVQVEEERNILSEKETQNGENLLQSEQEENKETERECDGDSKEEKEKEIPMKPEKQKEVKIDLEDDKTRVETTDFETDKTRVETTDFETENIDIVDSLDLPQKTDKTKTVIDNTNSLFSNLADEDDSFSTYSIYIMREGDTLEKIIDKYGVSKEALEEYNDLGSIMLNSKVIIPTSVDE